jgi:hypothetical protein
VDVTLSKEGVAEFEAVIADVKKKITTVVDDSIAELYTDIGQWIESDAWSNYRQTIVNGLKDYVRSRDTNRHDFVEMRRVMLRDYRAEIIADLNADMVEEIRCLKDRIQFLEESRSRY